MASNNPIIYAVRMNDSPVRYQSKFPLVEVVAHASSLSQEQKKVHLENGRVLDDACESSISHLNPWWGELTAVHWLLQQSLSGIIGNAQYRRRWDDESLQSAKEGTLYLFEPCIFPFSLDVQFRGGHSFPGVEMSRELAGQGRLPLTIEELDATWSQPRFQGGPMALAEVCIYKQLMSILFECLWPIWLMYEDQIRGLSGYDMRAMAFLSERLLSGIVLYHKKFLGSTPVEFFPLHGCGL